MYNNCELQKIQSSEVKSSIETKMQRENEAYFQEENSWFYCIGEIRPKKASESNPNIKTAMQIEQNDISSSGPLTGSIQGSLTGNIKGSQKQKFKRARQTEERVKGEQMENSSSNELKSKNSDSRDEIDRGKGNYLDKQHIYSKNYRQRKKQKVKFLQEENEFLKKKVHDLESRLREMQLQINRLKFTPEEKQYTIEQLNNEFMQKVTVIMEKNKDNPAEFKSKYDPKDPFYSQFMDTYSKHGFGGSKKIQIMNYYYNQILEAMLRDSERYFCLMCLNAQSGYEIKAFPEYQIISSVFFDILNPDQDKLKRLEFFSVNLHPLVLDFFSACKEFDQKFSSTVNTMNKIHEFMRINYPSNFDFARMRIVQLEAWFEKQKYTKMMRSLRVMWLDELKRHRSDEEKKKANGSKKKKLNTNLY